MSRENLINILQDSQKKSLNEVGQHHLSGETYLFVKDPLPENINIINVIDFVKDRIPAHLINLLDIVYVGQFDIFNDRKINAAYKDGALYITNQQDDENDMIDDIIHELAHAVEEKYREFLYDDEKLAQEFLRKREALRRVLKYEGYLFDNNSFMKTEYDADFDMFLLGKVGYPLLKTISRHIFASPYAATSLSEYYADGFEDYFLGKRRNLKEISPILYFKLEEIEDET